ncbi:MAG TPA: tetratricopeptide repeat protein, partial [Nitrosopumilaceae archaeon]|nr:tetratricopeptide repeat protein [Nitrosopumilaceae archaeon]
MKSVNKIQVGVIVGALALFVLLYIANKKQVKKTENVAGQPTQNRVKPVEMRVFVETKISGLSTPLKQKYLRLDSLFEKNTNNPRNLDSIVKFWDRLMMPDVASFFVEKQAELSKSAADWFRAGDRYYYSTRFIKDVNENSTLFQRAIDCITKSLALDSTNITAKIRLAACYVEGTSDPMKGIGLLKEVEKIDSNNVDLQLNFAMFSIKSGQWAKAISRLEKVIKLKPDYLEAYLFLADAYEQNGNKVKTIEMLEKYASMTP